MADEAAINAAVPDEDDLADDAPVAHNADPSADAEGGDVVADFDGTAVDVESQQYGLNCLMRLRDAMLPIVCAPEVEGLKFLICPETAEPDQGERRERPERDRDQRGKGKGRDRGGGGASGAGVNSGGRYVPEMGRTETMPGSARGQWWRNVASDKMDVLIRENFSLLSKELWKAPYGHYLQQGGACEVFVSGQATGLQRMPVQPRGWVTVDASAVGGPKYLEMVRAPRWKVVFRSGSSKGDIVVREHLSLDSEEVAVLLCGTVVEQGGPQELLEDGIIRMPIVFADGKETNAPAQASKCKTGWVTCDASSQGGPKFFEPCPEDPQPPPVTAAAPAPGQAGGGAPAEKKAEGWQKNRSYKVLNLDPSSDDDPSKGRQLPILARAEPYAPGGGRTPPEDIVVTWLKNDEVVEQTGHSKKTRGFMVMPVKVTRDGTEIEGWVTRRLVDKARQDGEAPWLEEIGGDGEEKPRRSRREKD